jgi:hypothetical protein
MKKMKNLKFPLIALLVAGLFTIAFIGCKKESLTPSVTSDAKGGGGTTPPPAFILHIPTAGTSCVGSEYCFNASFTNNGGNDPGGNNTITVTIKDVLNTTVAGPTVKDGTNNDFCFSGLAEGNYVVFVTFYHAVGAPVQGTLSFNLSVGPEGSCDFSCATSGLTLSRTSNVTASDAFSPLSVSVDYIVSNCSTDDYIGLKLQGGLVNKASGISHSQSGDALNVVDNSILKGNAANFVISYTFDLAAGKSNTFSASYGVYPVACDGPLTGAWSLKKDGVIVGTIDPAVDELGTTGYLDRLYYNCNP